MSTEFALIGHQESWDAASDVVSALRGPDHQPIPKDEIREILPWIPPRVVCHVDVHSKAGYSSRGSYIDSFIPPDRLSSNYVRENLIRVHKAAECAIRAGAKVVSLGGFSSILLEGSLDKLPDRDGTAFTTGNSLTVAFVVEGIVKMCAQQGRELARSVMLIVGATGDVGSGCARCLAPMVGRVLLHARNVGRLDTLKNELESSYSQVEVVLDGERFPADVDIVICAASVASPSLLLKGISQDAIVCDAGYPKNLLPSLSMHRKTMFHGGLGQVTGGMTFAPDLSGVLNRHPFPDVAHGCLLEGMVLALEGRYEEYSKGRGLITVKKVEEIHAMAMRHGICLAPFYNSGGAIESVEMSASEGCAG